MLLFRDLITGDEMCSDAFHMKLVDDAVYEVDCKQIRIGNGADVDVGANPSAEEQAEELEDGTELVNNVVYSFRLQATTFDKKTYFSHLKAYMKAVKAKLQDSDPSRVEKFEQNAQTFVKKYLMTNFSNYEFLTGENMDPNGMVVLLNYRTDGITPYLTYWKDGLKEEKL